jgi:ribonuclease HII
MVGVDEVGRGCWAGPLLVVAARQIEAFPEELTDSKLLNKRQREQLIVPLMRAAQFGAGWVDAAEIDIIGLANALRLGAKRALNDLMVDVNEEIIYDGKVNYIEKKYTNIAYIVDADLKIPIVSAASVYAKVLRDNYMADLSLKHPNYGFENHVGYGTKMHKLALEKSGIINGVHRASFKPVQALLQSQ